LAGREIEAGESFVAVHPWVRCWFKRWPVRRVASVIDVVEGKLGVKVVLLGGDRERRIAELILG